MQKSMIAIAGALVLLVLAGVGFLLLTGPDPADDAPRSTARLQIGDTEFGAPFELTSETGARIASAELIDRPALLYFGYTYCPDVCPIDTAILAETTGLLAEAGHDILPVFVSVDPGRDDPETLAYFTDAFHPQMVGLTGSPEEIRAVADAYKVYYERVEMEDSAVEYLVNHTAYMYLQMPDGEVAAVFRNGVPAEEIAAEIGRILDARG